MHGADARILLVGDELLSGEIEDRNGPFFADRLTDLGFTVKGIRILPDDGEVIAAEARDAVARSRLVVVCGGLGPTSDDRTTEAVGRAFGRKLVLDEPQWERIRQVFSLLIGEEPPPGNEKQAIVPEGSEILANEVGTAVGYVLREADGMVAVLPGPPKENRRMFEGELVPWLDRNMPERRPWRTRLYRVFGLPESEVGHRLRPLEDEVPGLRISYRFAFPEILVKLRVPEAREEALEAAGRKIVSRLAPHLYGTGDQALPELLGRELQERGLRVVTAESCTAGLAAKLLTDTPGSSAWMECGFVAYSNASKQRLLRVDGALLERSGAVSEETARAMLDGALAVSGADVGVAVTGVAGPGGGTPEKPVGTVWIAWGDRERREAGCFRFLWDRQYNRIVSAWAALHRLYGFLLGSSPA